MVHAMSAPVRILHAHSTFDLGGKEARAVRLMNAFGDAAEHAILSGQVTRDFRLLLFTRACCGAGFSGAAAEIFRVVSHWALPWLLFTIFIAPAR